MTFFLASGGKANSLYGDGVLSSGEPARISRTVSSTIR